MKLRIAFILSLFLLASTGLKATVTTAIADGTWGSGATWDNGVPGCFDTIVVPFEFTVEITATVDLEACDTIVVEVYGWLKFQTGKKLKLSCGSKVNIYAGGQVGVGGGGGSSTLVSFCGTDCWTAAAGDIMGPFVLEDGNCALLPISLVSFEANLVKGNTELTWVTKSELGNDYFTIFRSSDGLSWSSLLIHDGAGTSTETIKYRDVDETPLLGLNYYRLQQTDYNGNSAFFDPVVVNNNGTQFDEGLLIFPNPSGGDQVTIFLSGYTEETVDVYFISISGALVMKKTLVVSEGGLAVLVFEKEPAAGLYTLKVNGIIEKLVSH